jgi:CRP-like cAMP-binding protein
MARITKLEADVLKKSVFFGALPAAAFNDIMEASRIVDLEAGQALFEQGAQATSVFAVASGLIKLTVGQRDGREVLVELFDSGTSFAEALAFGSETYPVSAYAIVDSRVVAAPISAIHDALGADPEAFKAILAATFRYLHSLIRQIEELKGNSGVERVALYILARIDLAAGKTEFELPYDKKTMALALGIKPESLSRAFGRLANHGVEVSRRKVAVLDPDALLNFLGRGQGAD